MPLQYCVNNKLLSKWQGEEENPDILEQLNSASFSSHRTTCKLKTFPLANELGLESWNFGAVVSLLFRAALTVVCLVWVSSGFSCMAHLQGDPLLCYLFFCFTYRVEHHEVLTEYKEGVGKFIGKINLVLVCTL